MPLRRNWLLDVIGNIINPATYEAQVDGSQKTQDVDSNGNTFGSIQTESGLAKAVYLTDRIDSGMVSYHRENIGIGFYPIVLIDISDNINYNHTATSYAHIHMREFDIICDVNGAWQLNFGFIENVTEDSANFYRFLQFRGAKDVGNRLSHNFYTFPVGAALRSESLTTMPIVTDKFQSDVAVPSCRSFSVPDVFPSNGDVVCLLEVIAGNVLEFSSVVGYHSH